MVVTTAANGNEGLRLGSEVEFDAIVLDIGLPELDGYQVAVCLRANGCRVPMLMLTARDLEDDIIRGLSLGADGYMNKPFSFRELLARLVALSHRPRYGPVNKLQFAGLTIDTVQRKVFHDGSSSNPSDSQRDISPLSNWYSTQAVPCRGKNFRRKSGATRFRQPAGCSTR